ncbi:MAG: hypothetical protein IJX70_02120, partial [Clostridia bacterium]|nr:hypothetical protein [Clostridia bacterium]
QVIINAIEIENVWLNLPAATDGAHYLYNASYRSIGIAQAADEIVVSIVSGFTLTIGGNITSDNAVVNYTYRYCSPLADAGEESNWSDWATFTNQTVKNAGSYKIKATVSAAGDAAVDYLTKELEVTMVVARVHANINVGSDLVETYDGLEKGVSASNVAQTGEEVAIRYTMTNGQVTLPAGNVTSADGMRIAENGAWALHAGSYTVTVYINEASSPEFNANYYSEDPREVSITINKAEMPSLNYTQGTTTYDGQVHYLAIEGETSVVTTSAPSLTMNLHPFGNESHTDVATVSYIYQGAPFEGAVHAGTYTITASVTHRDYKDYSETATLTVNKADMWAAISGNEEATAFYFITEDGAEYRRVYDGKTYFVNVGTAASTALIDLAQGTKVTQMSIRPKNMALSQGLALGDRATIEYLSGAKTFEGAKNAGTYAITAIITGYSSDGHEDYEVITLTGTIVIEQVQFNNQAGHLPSIHLQGGELLFNAKYHYVGISRGEAAYVDSAVASVALLSGDGTATVHYHVSTAGAATQDSPFFTGALNADTYYVYAWLEYADAEARGNYASWEGNATLVIHKLRFENEEGHLGALYLVGKDFTDDGEDHYFGVSYDNTYNEYHVGTLPYAALGLNIAVAYT